MPGAFDLPRLTIAGLVEISLRAAGGLPARTIRLSDGGFLKLQGQTYRAEDPDFGAIVEVQEFAEQAGDEAPGGVLTFQPRSGAAAATLSQPGYQMSPIRFWLVRVDPQTGLADEVSAELLGDMLLDSTRLRFGRGTRLLDMEMIAAAERLMNVNEGNVLSSRFHKSVWPGELGLDNAVDVGVTVAWRVASPPRGSVRGGPSVPGGGGGGGAPAVPREMEAW